MYNLDDVVEREEFIKRFGILLGRALANRLGFKGKGAVKTANAVSCYAWNAETAYQCRLRGDVAVALQYDAIADRIYRDSLAKLGWW